MTGFMTICGYAIPFNQIANVGDVREVITPDAFDTALARCPRVFLNMYSHDAPPIAKGITLHTDSYGLGFIAAVPDKAWPGVRHGLLRDVRYCSISMRIIEAVERDGLRHVVCAEVEHVTLISTPAYAGTGVWPVALQHALPPRLRRLSARWHVGRHAWLARERLQAERLRAERLRVNTFEIKTVSGATARVPFNRAIADRIKEYARGTRPISEITGVMIGLSSIYLRPLAEKVARAEERARAARL